MNFKNGVQDLRNPMAVQADHPVRVGATGEIAVRDDQFIAVPHFHQYF